MPEDKKRNGSRFKATPLNKVLVAVDYSPSAQKIAETGYALAKSMNAEVALLHVVTDAAYYYTPEYSPIMGFTGYTGATVLNLIDVEKVKQASKEFLEKTREHLDDEHIKIIVEESMGDTAQVILDAAKKQRANLIVMGSHSRRWLEQVLLGSVTESVLHHTLIPLYIIPTKEAKK